MGRHWVWHAIIAPGRHTQSKNIGCGILTWPLDITQYQTIFGVAWPHGPCEAHTVGSHQACRAIIALGQHILPNDIDPDMS